MEYILHISNADYGADYPRFAVEIQPPLSETAAHGLCRALTTPKHPEAETAPGGYAREAFITRQDEEGTVIYILPNHEPHEGAAEVADYIKPWIDPAGLHTIHARTYHEGHSS